MTTPFERARAVEQTREFLNSLVDPKQTPRIPKSVRNHAYFCLRHYPSNCDLANVEAGWSDTTYIECPFATSDIFGKIK